MVTGFDYSPPLKKFINILASGSRKDRISLTRLDVSTSNYFSDSLNIISNLLPDSKETRAFTSIALLTRFLWSLVPKELINNPYPDFNYLAKKAIQSKFNLINGFEEDKLISDLAKIFKRIRLVYKEGRRNAKSLDFNNKIHLDLFHAQNKRCSLCAYEFELNQYRFSLEEEGVESFPYLKVEGEVCLEKTLRTPELDHIIPYVLGGDLQDNWQILCKSCNLGKSDYLNYMYAFSNQTSQRMSDLENLSFGKRYAVIAAGGIEIKDNLIINSGDEKYFRVFKINNNGFLDSLNLQTKYA
jgi:5-methylcytosine-specific restriction endonuclease McrA